MENRNHTKNESEQAQVEELRMTDCQQTSIWY